MLAPSVWNTSNTNIKSKILSVLYSDDKPVTDYIGKQCNNHFVSLILPNCNEIPPDLMKNILQFEYYTIKELHVSQLFTPLFVEYFINRGMLNAVTDTDSSTDGITRATITPNGILTMTIHKQLYYKLGLEGKILNQSKSKNAHLFYVVEIKMRCRELQSSNKLAKYHKAFEKCGIKLNWIMAWKATDKKVCPSSIAKFFCDQGYKVLKCRPCVRQYSSQEDIVCPVIKASFNDDNFTELLMEWLGALSIHSPISFDECMETEIRNNFKVISISGLITIDAVLMLYKYIVDMLRTSLLPWVSLHARGFDKTNDHYTVVCMAAEKSNMIISPA